MTIKGIKGVLTKAEYIGYLKGRIIDAVAVGAIAGLDDLMSELRIVTIEQETDADAPTRGAVGQTMTDASMIAIRDSMVRLDKK